MNEILQTINAEKAYDLIAGKLDSWLQSAIELLPNFVVALIVLIIFWLCAKLVKRTTSHLMHRFSNNQGLTSLFSATRVGDILDTNDHFGTVTEMNLRATIIKDFQGQEIIIPNKEVYQKPIKNYSRYSKRRVDLSVGISYGDNLQKVKDVVLEAINGLDLVDKSKPVDFAYQGFGDSSIDFNIYYWVSQPNQMNYNLAVSAGVMAVKKAFDENEITIPFPIRTLDFGIKGGEKFHQSVNQIEFLKTINSNQNPKN